MINWKSGWYWLTDSAHALLDLMGAGGTVMWLLAALSVLFWTLLLERFWYVRWRFPQMARDRRSAWHQLRQQEYEQKWLTAVRSLWVAQAREQLLTPLGVVKALVALFPLLGLLGTVTGMVAVFDVLAGSGSSNPRAMAGGVWKATLPTLTGMVLAIAGLFSVARLERNAHRALGKLADKLRHE